MMRRLFVTFVFPLVATSVLLIAPGCASKPEQHQPAPVPMLPPKPPVVRPAPAQENLRAVMLGIDVLEAEGFKAIAGKRIGLLTHPAGVNRRGESTINVLRRAPQSKLVALFAPEHGFDGDIKAATKYDDSRHLGSGLPIYSLYGNTKKPTPAMLRGLDAVVIDLQDIGVRSYTFSSWMRYTMEACFENNIEVIVLDRPNPLGGFKVDGPPLDAELMSDVGAFRVPYVHGLTMGELATMAKQAPHVLDVSEKVRAKGRLTVVRMRGWTRLMRWPETGLRWIATSPNIPSYDAVVGYAMIGLGCQNSGWSWGIGNNFHFRSIGYPKKSPEETIAALEAYKIPGIDFVKRDGRDREGKAVSTVYVEVSDWFKWNPTELSFYMQKQAEKWEKQKIYAKLTPAEQRTFLIHVGSKAWYNAIKRDGMRVDVATFVKKWKERSALFKQQSRKYWLYQ